MSNLKYVLEHTMLEEDEVIALVLPSGKRVWKGFVKDAYALSESYSFNRFVKQEEINETFNKPAEVLEVSEIKKETERPVKGEYSLSNKGEVLKAIKFFNYQKEDKEEDYANAIINKMHEFGIGCDAIPSDSKLCKYVDSCTADLSEEGHLSGSMTTADIAKKHGVSVDEIEKQVKRGIEVEHEHTSDDDEAKRIALDHLFELPDYYDRLEDMEHEGEKELSEASIPGEHKCLNCGATLDAWDGAFCDEECKKQYNEKNHSTNEEILTEKPLYTEDGKTEVKRYNGESYKTMKEVNDDKDKQMWTRETDVESGKQIGHGAFSPSGKYFDSKDGNPGLVFKAESPISGRMLKKKVDNK